MLPVTVLLKTTSPSPNLFCFLLIFNYICTYTIESIINGALCSEGTDDEKLELHGWDN